MPYIARATLNPAGFRNGSSSSAGRRDGRTEGGSSRRPRKSTSRPAASAMAAVRASPAPAAAAAAGMSGGRPSAGLDLDRGERGALPHAMAEKLGIGAAFPSFPLTLVDGRTIAVPDQLEGRYRAILFYRGHW